MTLSCVGSFVAKIVWWTSCVWNHGRLSLISESSVNDFITKLVTSFASFTSLQDLVSGGDGTLAARQG